MRSLSIGFFFLKKKEANRNPQDVSFKMTHVLILFLASFDCHD